MGIETANPAGQHAISAATGLKHIPKSNSWLAGMVALIFFAIAAIYAFSTSSSYFAYYDDEGFMMISVRGFLEGNRLYDDIFTYYGPFYYFYEWFVHSVVALPLTHDVTRVLCLIHWLAAAGLLAWAAGKHTRSVLISFFVFMQATLHLTPLAREPSHPQELIALLLPLAVLAAERGWQRKWIPALLGAIGAALIFTKINVGLFFGLALLLAWCSQATWFRSRRILFGSLLALTALLPCLLMRPNLAETWAQAYCGQVCVAIITTGLLAYLFEGRTIGKAKLFQAGGAFVILSAIFLGILLFRGTSLSATLEHLITAPARVGSAFSVPLKVPHCSWSGVLALLAAIAVAASRLRLNRLQLPIMAAKAIYGLLGTWLFLGHYNQQLGYLLPWSWLVLVPLGTDGTTPNGDRFTRTFLCLLAVWQGLQAYPIAGTQAVIGTLLPILVYSLCLHDAIRMIAITPWAIQRRRSLTLPMAKAAPALVVAVMLYVFAMSWCHVLPSWRYYDSNPPLGLRGSRLLHLPSDQTETYRALTQYLEAESDTFITIPGLNSLYFWTGKNPPTYFNAFGVVLLNENQQRQIIVALQKAKRPLIVLNEKATYSSAVTGPLGDLISQQGREIKKIGGFRILELNPPAPGNQP